MTDIERFKSAGDQLRAAWDNYAYIFSALQNQNLRGNAHLAHGFPAEFCRQLDTELAFLPSLGQKIQQVKNSITRARNYSSGLAPINSLPPEILTSIFHLVLAQPCYPSSLHGQKRCHPIHLDHLTQVCHLWRTTAITNSSFWTHIDFSDICPLPELIPRVRVALARAGTRPIQLDLKEHDNHYIEPGYDYDRLARFIGDINNRVETLELITSRFGYFQHNILSGLLSNQHSILTKLTMRTTDLKQTGFIIAAGQGHGEIDPEEYDVFELDLTQNQLESVFSRLTALELDGICPLWPSKAYHGLVDLRLLPNERFNIQEKVLVAILKSSPGLEILHFGLHIVPSTQDTESASVYLQNLQVLKVFVDDVYVNTLLRLLAPGTKDLRLHLEGHKLNDDETTELESFFTRSRVTRFYARKMPPPMGILLRHAAHLECVVFDGFQSGFRDLELDLGSLSRLRSLHVTRSVLSEADLRLFLDCCPDGTVVHSCTINCGRDTGILKSAKEVSDAFPGVKTTEYTFYPLDNPTASWEILG